MARELLETRVEEVMRRGVITVDPQETLTTVATTMLDHGIRHLPVVTDTGELVGIISERDLRARMGTDLLHWAQAESQLRDVVENAMSPDPLMIQASSPLQRALDIFEDERVGAIMVVDEGERLLGVLSYVDVIDWVQRKLAQLGASERPPPRPAVPVAAQEEKTRELTGSDASPSEATQGSAEPPPGQQGDLLPEPREEEEEPTSPDITELTQHPW